MGGAEVWLSELLREGRARMGANGSPTSNLEDFRSPCQLILFTFENPPLARLFILHSERSEDGLVRHHHAVNGFDLLQCFDQELSDTLWDTLFDDALVTSEPDEPKILRTLARRHLVNFIHEIQSAMFRRPRAFGGKGGSYFVRGSAVWSLGTGALTYSPKCIIWDDLTIQGDHEIPAVKLVPDSHVGTQRFPDLPEPSKTEVYGALLFPKKLIGQGRQLSFGEGHGRSRGYLGDFGDVVFEKSFAGTTVVTTSAGFVGAEGSNSDVRFILDSIVAASIRHKHEAVRVAEHEIIQGAVLRYPSFATVEYRSMPVTSRILAASAHEPFLIPDRDHLTVKKWAEIVASAEGIYSAVSHDELSLWLEAFSHLFERQTSQSFFFSWLLIERYLGVTWARFLESREIEKNRRKKLEKPGGVDSGHSHGGT